MRDVENKQMKRRQVEYFSHIKRQASYTGGGNRYGKQEVESDTSEKMTDGQQHVRCANKIKHTLHCRITAVDIFCTDGT